MHKCVLGSRLATGTGRDLLAGSLHPRLEQQTAEMGAEEWVKVLVVLKDQVDIPALDWELHQRKAPLAERHLTVIEQLQAKAAATQPALLQALAQDEQKGLVKDVRDYWLLNAIVLKCRVYHLPVLAELDAGGHHRSKPGSRTD